MKVAVELWKNGGMINHLISLEIAVGLSSHYDIPITMYNFGFNTMYNPLHRLGTGRNELIKNDIKNPIHLFDLLNWNSSGWDIVAQVPEELNDYKKIEISKYYVDCDPSMDDNYYSSYKELKLEKTSNYNFISPVCFYSRTFKNRSQKIDMALSEIKWKSEYLKLANKISKELGDFSGMHLRSTDLNHTIFTVGDTDFLNGLSFLEEKSLPIVLSTDNTKSEIVLKNQSKYKIIDQVIMENWYESFKALPNSGETVLGLLSNLVMGHSKNFIGTPGSTYTAYIQRCCNQRQNNFEWNFFSGKYGTYHIQNTKKYGRFPRWWREFPESKLNM